MVKVDKTSWKLNMLVLLAKVLSNKSFMYANNNMNIENMVTVQITYMTYLFEY